jgi:ribonuclease G
LERELVVVSSKSLYMFVIFENREAVELRVEYLNNFKQSGNIYKGKVKRIVPAMNAAFVDIGEDREAFLPLKDIEKICPSIQVGKSILVQIKRAAINTKGAKLTCKITLPGKYIVLLPTTKQISISSKIENKKLKEDIKELLEPFNKEGYGFIIRTSAEHAQPEGIIEDFISLKNLWEKIQKQASMKKMPSLIYEEKDKIFSILRDYAGEISKIITDDIKLYKELKKHIKKHFPDKNISIELYRNKNASLYSSYQIDRIIGKVLNPYVWLKSGGYLVIEETEALVTIDVNSGKHCKHQSLEDTAYHTNLEAAKEIAKHMRLRDLGGIIVIDFIDMKSEERKEALKEFLKEEVKKDKRPVKIKDFTSLGLLELTRKKLEESLIKQLSDICRTCKGRGYTKNYQLLLFEIEKRIEELKPFAKLSIKIHPSLEEIMKEFLRSLQLEEYVELKYDINLSIDKYSIERLA